jgi:hypothetical protein
MFLDLIIVANEEAKVKLNEVFLYLNFTFYY